MDKMQIIENTREIHKRWKPLYTKDYRFILYYGGRGGRKSWEVADSLIRSAIQESIRILCTREIQNSIKESVYQLLVMRMNTLGYAHEFYITNTEIIHKQTGSKFIFKGLNDINDKSTQSLKSLEDIDKVWIEEAQTITKQSLDVLIPTIRKPNSQIIATFNRLEEDDPIWDLVENPRPRTYSCYVTYLENPDISEEFLQEADFYKINKPEEYEHIYLGIPRKYAQNTVVRYFTDDNNIQEINYVDELPLYITCDFNVDPMCWELAHIYNDKIYFFDELVIENTDSRESAEEFLRRYPKHKTKLILCGDASGNARRSNNKISDYATMRKIFENYGYKVEKAYKSFNPRIENRVSAWNSKILTFDGKRDILIDPKCKRLIYNCKKLKYKVGTSIIDEPTPNQIEKNSDLKFMKHPFDAASYLVDRYYPIRPDKK